MGWMHRSAEKRADVRLVVPNARSVIVTATLYNTERPYSADLDADVARISRYAWGDDYHDVLTERLEALVAWMRAESADPFEARAYVDTGPVQERVYAQYAGLGWIGKNTCLINPEIGSWLFLGEIITTLDLEADARGTGAVRQLHEMSRGVSDRCTRRAGRPRLGALPVLSDD